MTTLRAEIFEPVVERIAVTDDNLSVDLTDGRTIFVPLAWYPRLLHGTREERSNWRLIADGEGVHWPELDEDISAENLVLGKPSGESQQSLQRWLEERNTPPRSRPRIQQPVVKRELSRTVPSGLQFRHARSAANDCVIGYMPAWEHKLSGGGYDEDRDFLYIHWQINIPKGEQTIILSPELRQVVRLHVESPRHASDQVLNDLKLRIIRALFKSTAQQTVRSAGFEYRQGPRTSDTHVRKNKSTEAFRVIVQEGRAWDTHQALITGVHGIVGHVVDKVVHDFAEELEERFGRSGG